MRIHPVFIRVLIVVAFCGVVHDDRFVVAYAFEAVIDVVGDFDEEGGVVAYDEFVDHAVGGGVFAAVVEDDFHLASYADEMVGLFVVVVPGFDHAGVGGGHVDLAELDVVALFVVGAEHFHQPAALV